MNATVILNPNAGNNTTEQLIAEIERAIPNATIIVSKQEQGAIDAVKDAQTPIIIAAGGDGTVNEVMNGIMKYKKKAMLGIIPTGTSNILARALDIPTDIPQAIDLIVNRRHKAFDLGKINDRYFIIAAGVGIDAHMYQNVEPKLKKMFGPMAYTLTYIKTIFNYEPKELRIELDGKKYTGYYVLISNLGKYPPLIKTTKKIVDNDGLLDVFIFTKLDLVSQFKYLYDIVADPKEKVTVIVHLKAKQLTIISNEKVIAHADAEIIGSTPLNVEVISEALDVIC